jgi:hypothetical protein
MSASFRPLAIVLLLIAVPAAPAAEPLDLVPDNACFGLAMRSLADMKPKADALYTAAELQKNGGQNFPTPNQIVAGIKEFVPWIDDEAPAAFIVINPADAGLKSYKDAKPEEQNALWVLVLPFKDRAKLAENLEVKPADLKEGKIVTRQKTRFGLGNTVCVRGKYVFVAEGDKGIAALLKPHKPAFASLPEARRRFLAGADLQLYFRPETLRNEWNDALKADWLRELQSDKYSEAERQAVADLVDALKSIRLGLGALRIEETGLGLGLMAVFPDKVPEPTRRFLTSLGGDSNGSELKGLPEGAAVFAEAAKGEGAPSARLMKALAGTLLRDVFVADWLPTAADRANVLAAFAEVWRKLAGHRFAFYQNADPVRHGLFSAVAILDTADADRFLADLRLLARLAGTEGLDLSATGREEDVAEVEKLIRDLGSRRFRERESASDRLLLIGEPALARIEKALASNDPEVRSRAGYLKTQIINTAVARRKELLSSQAPWRIRPTFRFEAKPEERSGHRVEIARVRLTNKDAPAAEVLRHGFGPDWDKVRLVKHGKQVVVLLGSDETLLDKTLANLEDGKPGLAAAPSLTRFARQADPARKLEVHGSVGTVLALLQGEDLRRGKPAAAVPALSSASLVVGAERLRLDLWLPAPELGAVVKKTMGGTGR